MIALSRRRLFSLGARAAAIPYAAMFFEAEAQPLAYNLKATKNADGIWTIYGVPQAITRENGGAIANISILDSTEGAILVDTGPSRRYGEELTALAKSLTGKDVARAYITHFHPDHAFGNQAVPAERLAAPQGVIDGLRSAGAAFSDAMYYIAQDWMRGTEIVLPARAVESGIEDIGGRRLHLFSLAGHTASDLAVLDESTRTLIAGDLAFLDRAPTTPHADVSRWLDALKQLEALDAARIVPGHGPVEEGARALVQTREWLTQISEIIRTCFEKGMDMLEAAQQPLPDNLNRIALSRYEFERSILHFYPRLEAERLPAVGKKSSD